MSVYDCYSLRLQSTTSSTSSQKIDRPTKLNRGSVFYLITLKKSNHYDQVSISALPLKYAQWMDIYAYHLEHPGLNYIQLMTTAEISDKLVSRGSIKKPMSMSRLGMVLQQAGFQSKRIGKARTRGWLVRERGMEEVNANRNIEGRG